MILRTCEHCAIQFLARPRAVRAGGGRFCGHPCYGAYRLDHPEEFPWWKGDAASRKAGHSRARYRFRELGTCEVCREEPAVERHHRDANTLNNRPENVARICRRCHQREDGRLERLATLPRVRQLAKPCAVCGLLSKPLRRGLCGRCRQRRPDSTRLSREPLHDDYGRLLCLVDGNVLPKGQRRYCNRECKTAYRAEEWRVRREVS